MAPMPIPADYNGAPSQSGHVVKHRGYALLLTELIMIAITLLIVGLRLYTRVHILGAMHSDDWWILLATAILIGLTAVHGVGVKYGIGKHMYDISQEHSNIALTMSYIGQILYVMSLACVKISLLLFLQRIFPLGVMRRIVRGMLIFVLCFAVTNVFLFAFQCDTPGYYFTKIRGDAKTTGGVCLPPQVVYYPMAVVNILTDVIIWLLPVPTILKARLSKKEKLGLLWVFLIGGVAVCASIVRPVNLHDIMEDGDPTWNMVNVSVWAMVEISVGILCTSIPVIKPLVLRVAPRLLITNRERSCGGADGPDGSHTAQRNSFTFRSIKVTHDIHQVEGDAGGMQNYGLQQPDVSRGFDDYKEPLPELPSSILPKAPAEGGNRGPDGSDERVLARLSEESRSVQKEGLSTLPKAVVR